MNRPLSDREYVKEKGINCPFCGSGDLESIEGPQGDGTDCWQEIECLKCHRTWRDVYRLIGYERTDEGSIYLIFNRDDIEPEVIGPFNDEDQRDKKARELRREHGDEHGIFMLYVARNDEPTIHAYSGGFFEEVSEG